MKSNELFEQIHNGKIKENTRIEVKTEEGRHIAYIDYRNGRLNWASGEFDTRYLCDIKTEFEIYKFPWEIEKLNLEGKLTGEKIELIKDKTNEIIDKINEMYGPLPF